MKKGFTLIELIVVVAIIGVLTTLIMFTASQYINKGKDSSVQASLNTLVPAGEVWYNYRSNQNGDGYNLFCDSTQNNTLKNVLAQMPTNTSGPCGGNCCNVNPTHDQWASCSQEFTDKTKGYCVDSRGVKEEVSQGNTNWCNTSLFQCP